MNALSRELRQVLVGHLARAGKNPTEIAAELGISRHTASRDLQSVETLSGPETASDAAPDERDVDTLVLPLDPPLRKALAVLRSVQGGADTDVQNRAAVRAAVRATADAVLEARQEVRS
ncbi:helix-turn-helix domain-containing protein [Streptomyces sp. NPDC002547]